METHPLAMLSTGHAILSTGYARAQLFPSLRFGHSNVATGILIQPTLAHTTSASDAMQCLLLERVYQPCLRAMFALKKQMNWAGRYYWSFMRTFPPKSTKPLIFRSSAIYTDVKATFDRLSHKISSSTLTMLGVCSLLS